MNPIEGFSQVRGFTLFLLIGIALLNNHDLAAQDCLPEGIIFNSQQEIDDFAADYPGCSVVLGNVVVFEGNREEITNLNALNQIRRINGSLALLRSDHLRDLSGLNNLGQIDEGFVIRNMERLQNISSLTKLTDVGGELRIDFLDSLTTLNGIENLVEVGGNVTLSLLEMLEDISALSSLNQINGALILRELAILEELNGLEGISLIDSSLIIDRLPQLASLSKLSALQSVGDDIEITDLPSLVDLNGFEGLNVVPGSLTISGGMGLQSLTGLNNLTSVGHEFRLEDNDNLVNYAGLEKLKYIGGDLVSDRNQNLVDFTGLVDLDQIGGSLCVTFNNSLETLEGLQALAEIGASIKLYSNHSLTRLGGLFNVTTIGGNIELLRNTTLTKIDALENIDPMSVNAILFRDNDVLSTCEVPTICGFLAIPGSTAILSDNATGCNTRNEIEDNCPGILPVVWSRPLTATSQGKLVLLNWQVSNQQDNDHFTIERSTDGTTFLPIGQVQPGDETLGTVDYTFTDDAPFNGENFFRVQQVDYNGSFTYSNIVRIRTTARESLQVFPNPVKGVLQIAGLYLPAHQVSITNIYGQVVYQAQVSDGKVDLSNQPPGLYALTVAHYPPVKIIKKGD